MNRFKQQLAIMLMTVMLFFSGVASSQAASATVTLDWSSFNAVLYNFPWVGSGEIPGLGIGEDYDNVYASHGLTSDEVSAWGWSGITVAEGSATASTTTDEINSAISLDGGGPVYASSYRVANITIPGNGLLFISIGYTWNVEGYNPDPSAGQSIWGQFYLSSGSSEADSKEYSHIRSDRSFSFYGGDPNTSGNGSGTVTLYVPVIDMDSIQITAGATVSGNSPEIPLNTPVPASLVMLFSGLAGLSIIRRRK